MTLNCAGRWLSTRQRNDPKFLEVIKFLETGALPLDEKQSRVLMLTRSRFHLKGGVLYPLELDGTLRVIHQEKNFLNKLLVALSVATYTMPRFSVNSRNTSGGKE